MTDQPSTQLHYLVGKVKDLKIALKVTDVRGVEKVHELTPLPGAPQGLAGLVFFQGGIEAAIDIGILLGKEKWTPNPDSCAVLAESQGLRGVLLFDTQPEPTDIPANEHAVKRLDDNDLRTSGSFTYESGDVKILSVSALLSSFIAPIHQTNNDSSQVSS